MQNEPFMTRIVTTWAVAIQNCSWCETGWLVILWVLRMGHHAMSLSLVFNKWSTVEYSYNQYCRLNSELYILKYCVIWLHFESVIPFQGVCLNAVRDSLIFPPEKYLSHLADYILFNFFPLCHCIQSGSWTQLTFYPILNLWQGFNSQQGQGCLSLALLLNWLGSNKPRVE
jgi:hypothetical protein